MRNGIARVRAVTLLAPGLQDRWRDLAGEPRLEVEATTTILDALFVARLSCDVLLVDATFQPGPPVWIPRVRAITDTVVVVATPEVDLPGVLPPVMAGASGCVGTDWPVAAVADALHAAAQGLLAVPRSLIADVVMTLTEGASPIPAS